MDEAEKREAWKQRLEKDLSLVTRFPQDSGLRLKLAATYYALAQYDDALEQLKEASHDPKLVGEVLFYRGRINMQQGSFAQAILDLREAEYHFLSVSFLKELRLHLINCLQKEGRDDEADRFGDPLES